MGRTSPTEMRGHDWFLPTTLRLRTKHSHNLQVRLWLALHASLRGLPSFRTTRKKDNAMRIPCKGVVAC